MSSRKQPPSGPSGGPGSLPTPVRGGRKAFGNKLTVGLQLEYSLRRLLPLSEDDSADLRRLVGRVVQANRRRYKWFFVSLLVSVKGGLYRTSIIEDPEAENRWEVQWVSTPVTNHIKKLRVGLDNLLDVIIPLHLRGRMGKILRYRVVFLRNPRRKPE